MAAPARCRRKSTGSDSIPRTLAAVGRSIHETEYGGRNDGRREGTKKQAKRGHAIRKKPGEQRLAGRIRRIRDDRQSSPDDGSLNDSVLHGLGESRHERREIEAQQLRRKRRR